MQWYEERVHGTKELTILQHNCFLGIAKALFIHWFSPPKRNQQPHPHNIYTRRLVVNARFQSIQAPHNWGRHPRTLLELGKHWKGITSIKCTQYSRFSLFMKAEEWKKWILIFAPAVLYRVLPYAAHEHLMHFVTGINLLLGKVTVLGLQQGNHNTEHYCA